MKITNFNELFQIFAILIINFLEIFQFQINLKIPKSSSGEKQIFEKFKFQSNFEYGMKDKIYDLCKVFC